MAKAKKEPDVLKIKKLTPAELKKQNKKLDGQYEVNIVLDGDVYKINIDEHFRKTKIFKLMDDLVEFFNQANKVGDASMLELATPYSTLLIIKHFTDIEISDNIDEALTMLDVMIDLECLDKIVNAMPENEVEKVYEMLANMMRNMERNLEEAEKEAEKLKNQVENQEVKDMIQ